MVQLGYALSSEEHRPLDLVRYAAGAEEAGFEFATISDHYHPWVAAQGQSPFIWTVLGGIAVETKNLRVGTSVTCPIIRYHPGLVAQMAATAASMLEGRFFLGVGSGEFLNEHVFGDHFPPPAERQEMLVEAVDIIRALWEGDFLNYHGHYYMVEEARIYTLPKKMPPIYMAADGPRAARIAGEVADGLISVAPLTDFVREFEGSGGHGKPKIGQITVCWAKSEKEAKATALKYWPNSALKGQAHWDIRSPRLFDGLVKMVTQEDIAQEVLSTPDEAKHIESI
ncbi:MAG TPA: TIGR03557 family F420-dependent LLM class oxidoreductase, partial [Tepidiformaceae bacterium]|nr:TIGR03557 family F420-dependent LLM class oxidoreductase [Tepidiformaceae bacterium]